MSVTSCIGFLQEIHDSPDLRQRLKAITGPSELIALGDRHGYEFDAGELAAASASFEQPGATGSDATGPGARTAFYHYEFDLETIAGLDTVARELPHLTIRPDTVDLAAFDAGFRPEDLHSLEHPPTGPAFERLYRELQDDQSRAGASAARRDFHLVNLDEHITHPGYPEYFAAKIRVIATLEEFFGAEVRFSGSLWYPPRSYRLWHTNETQPGWRMYVVDLDAEPAHAGQASFFRYQNPVTGELVTLPERRRIVRFFKAEQDPQRLFWHCIANPGPHHRWSFGFVVPDDWRRRFPAWLTGAGEPQDG